MPLELSNPPSAAGAHQLSICSADGGEELQTFLDQHWKRRHVLARSRALLDWQHLDRNNGRYNFVVARREGGEIDAILGFIPTYQFDATLQSQRDLWLAIWKVRDGSNAAGLGLTLLSHLVREFSPRSISAIGLAQGVIPIYKFLGFTVGQLDHHYIANRRRERFSLLGKFDGRWNSGARVSAHRRLTHCDVTPLLFSSTALPLKSVAYIRNRYTRHPVYRYDLFAIGDDASNPLALIVVRKASHAGAHALRVVDYFGAPDALRGCGDAFQSLLEEYGAEYIDFYSHGLPAEALQEGGFLRRTSVGSIIVPNYFEPFEQRNVDLDFAYKIYAPQQAGPFTLFKGDSDQDRPSFVGAPA
jgi:hypothetical protein